MEFVSKDKKTIMLPAPLGSIIYECNSSCGDFCYFQKQKFNELFKGNEKDRCGGDKLCHTRYIKPSELTINLNNLEWVLRYWGTNIFLTEDEAAEVTKKRINEHILQLKTMGFEMDDTGYSLMSEEKD